AWIMRASRNLALDVVRRRKVFQNKQAEIIRLMDRDGVGPDEAIFSEDEIADDRLRLMFVCCHPAIPADAQVALALKTLCGFGVTEISRAFLTTDAAIAKRLTRAKQKIRQARIPFEIPGAKELGQRLDSEGNLLRLKEQDRIRWDQATIARGMFHLAQSAAGDELSEYHLQAGIAACHCAAKDYESTDWQQILSLYDRLIEFDQSPVVALNRAVAIANIHGPRAGLQTVEGIRGLDKLSSYYLLYAVLGEFEMRTGKLQSAAEQFRRSFELAETKSERAFLLKRLQRCVDGETAESGKICPKPVP